MADQNQDAPSATSEPAGEARVFMVEFIGTRKELYRNPYELKIKPGDWVILQVERGEDVGQVITAVPAARVNPANIKPLPILRLATSDELHVHGQNRQKEMDARVECLKLIAKRGLKMKLVDVEWQYDGNKVTFYFTAEKRVDFRELVKDLAAIYRTRIELRQIGARDEARRVGGLGVCGLQQCCNAFLREFEPITTQLAREQSLSLNPAKISGNCGRLLCCLRHECEFYRQVMKSYPKPGSDYTTDRGKGRVDRIIVLRDQMVLRHESGEEEKVRSVDVRRATRRRPWMKS